MAISIDDLRARAAQARAEAAAAGELTPTNVGDIRWDIPPAAAEAILDDVATGTYEQSAQEATAGDPEMTQL